MSEGRRLPGSIEGRSLWGSARDFAWLYSPSPFRSVLGPLLDIEREIAAALRPVLDHGVAHVRLAWWREECGRCAAGHPVHPASRALLRAAGGPVNPIGLVETAEWDLAAATFETRSELAAYCERWASAMTEIAAQRGGSTGTGSAPDGRLTAPPGAAAVSNTRAAFGRRFGAALKELELLTAIADDARAGRLRLPLDELAQAGFDPAALPRAPWTPALCQLIAVRHRTARTALAESLTALRPGDQPDLRGLLVWGALAARASRRTERAVSRSVSSGGRPGETGPAARLADSWQAWRAARRADRHRFRLIEEIRA